MRRVHLSASGLARAEACIASAVLETAGHSTAASERGTGLHGFLLDVNRVGRVEALKIVKDDDLRAACERMNLDRLPVDPSLYAAEVAFAFDVVTGKARELGRGLNRDYSAATSTEIPGTADVVALVGDDAVHVLDYKSGWRARPTPELDWQFRFLGLAGARTYGRTRARVTLIRLGSDGEPFSVGGDLDMFDLAEVAESLRELHADATRAAAADVEPRMNVGAHCAECDSRPFCPAQTSLIRAAAGGAEVVGIAGLLSPEHAVAAYHQVEALESLVKTLREQLDDYATQYPITMPDGRIYGPVEKSRSSPEGAAVWHLLRELVGEEEAWKHVEIRSTWKSINEVARLLALKDGRKITHVDKELRERLYGSKSVKTKFWQSVALTAPRKEGGR